MKLENQVCTLEQAKKLAELGIVQESYFKHVSRMIPYQIGFYFQLSPSHTTLKHDAEWYSAFTGSELGVMLPPHFATSIHDGHKHCHCRNERVDTFPLIDSGEEHEQTPAHVINKELIPITTGNTEAEARAEMLIYLLENGYVSAESANCRLYAAI